MHNNHALAMLLPFLLGGCLERTHATASDAPRPVQAMRVVLAPAKTTRRYVGLIRPRHEADIAFRVSGRLIERSVDLGAPVTAGQVLARLDETDLALSLRSAEAALAAAAAQNNQAQAEAQRYSSLVKQGHVSASDDDAKQAAARTARQHVISAQAELQLAQNRLSYATLRAPAHGVVTAILADPGTVVSEGTAVLRIADSAPPDVEIAVPETALGSLARDAVSVILWARPDDPL